LYPELVVVDHRPPSMNDEHYEKLTAERLQLDDPPAGMLKEIVADRDT